MLRGGSWINNQNNARAAYRNDNNPDNRNNNIGFRVVVRRSTPCTFLSLKKFPFYRVPGLSGWYSRLLDREPGSAPPEVAASSLCLPATACRTRPGKVRDGAGWSRLHTFAAAAERRRCQAYTKKGRGLDTLPPRPLRL